MTTAFHQVKNNAYSTLAAGISDAATSFTVPAGEGARFPSTTFWVTIDDEIIAISSRTGDIFTVYTGGRGAQSTVAAAHAAGAAVKLHITAGEIAELQTAVNAHDIATTGIHGAGSNTIAHTGLIREKLTANRTYYVRTDGNDSNTGLVNDASGAFLTIQKAIDTAAALDCSIYNITIQLGAGTYVVTSAIVLKSIIGSGSVTIIGDETTPTNVVIDGQGAFPIIYCNAVPYTVYYLKGFKIYSSTANATRAIQSTSNSFVNFQNINFGTGITQYHLSAEYGGVIYATGNYTISGGTYAHVSCNNGTISIAGVTVTITGTPAFSGAYAFAQNCGVAILHACTFSGSATGTRYNISMNGVCYVAGAGATYLPGDVAGTTATGGQYA